MAPLTENGTFSLDDSVFRLRSDRSIDPLLAMQYSSVRSMVRDVFRLYSGHFRTLAAIYLLAVVPLAYFGMILKASGSLGAIASMLLPFFGGTFAFAAIAVAVSDVCSGNRPGVRRSYRRIFGVRLGVVLANTLLYYLAILLPMFITAVAAAAFWPLFVLVIFLTVFLALRYMFVPVISAIEPRPGIHRAFARSAWLGKGYRTRAFLMFVCIGAPGLLIAFLAHPLLPDVIEVFAAVLIFPPLYVAVVLQYYDLRARKEGFRLVELPEDIV
jgi:hypothetical protein